MMASGAPGCHGNLGLCILVEFNGASDKYLPPFALAASADAFKQLPALAGLETYVIGGADVDRLAAAIRKTDIESGPFSVSLPSEKLRRNWTAPSAVAWLRQVLAAADNDRLRTRVVSYLARAGSTA
jgi:hypothetical protein